MFCAWVIIKPFSYGDDEAFVFKFPNSPARGLCPVIAVNPFCVFAFCFVLLVLPFFYVEQANRLLTFVVEFKFVGEGFIYKYKFVFFRGVPKNADAGVVLGVKAFLHMFEHVDVHNFILVGFGFRRQVF